MNKPTFVSLCTVLRQEGGLCDKRETTVEENVLLFIRHGLCGDSNRATQENRQRSAATISGAVHEVADSMLSMEKYFIPGPPLQHVGPRPGISGNPKLSPFFDEFDGAVDGTHVPAFVHPSLARVWRDRKGNISQNVLIYFGFDLEVLFTLAGWEGTAHDARVLDDAIENFGFPRRGKKCVDAAYTLTKEFIKPYPGVRYHLKEWGAAQMRPQDKKELFNLRHATARNCAERGNGVLKSRFPVLRTMKRFPMDLQVKVVKCALCLHNFIRRHATYEADEFDDLSEEQIKELVEERLRDDKEVYEAGGAAEDDDDDVPDHGEETGKQWRDRVTGEMWVQYQAELARRGLV